MMAKFISNMGFLILSEAGYVWENVRCVVILRENHELSVDITKKNCDMN